MRTVAIIGVVALGLGGLIAIGCTPTPYGEADDGSDHATTSKTKSDVLPTEATDGTTSKKTTTGTPKAPVTTTGSGATTTAPTTVTSTPGSGGTGDAGAATPTTTADGGTCSPTAVPPTGYLSENSRAKSANACSQSDIGFYEGLLNVKGISYANMEQQMRDRSTSCASCIFSNVSDTEWTPVVMLDANNGFFNWGSCYANAPSGSQTCANQVQQWFDCLDDVCSTCTDDASTTACQNKASADPTSCGGLPFDGCGSSLTSLNTACTTAAQAINAACGQ